MQHERRPLLKIILILFLTLLTFCFIFKQNHPTKNAIHKMLLIFIFF